MIPEWVVDIRLWDEYPELGTAERRVMWSRAIWEWLDYYGYDVFDLNDREIELRDKVCRA